MVLSSKDAAKRILVCGANDVQYVLPKYNVGLVFITKPYLDPIDYGGIPSHECYIPNPHQEHYTPQLERNNQDVALARKFLEENPDQYLLVHCNAGIGVSPSFVLMLLLRLQEGKPDLDGAIRTVRQMTIDFGIEIEKYKAYLPFRPSEIDQAVRDYKLASAIH